MIGCARAADDDSAAPPQGSKVHMHGQEGYAADGYLFEPAGAGPFGAVLAIHDETGLGSYVRGEAQTLAAAGLITVAIDLYRGQGPASGKPSNEDALHDLNAALAFLRSLPTVRPGALCVAGWGMGADYALQLAKQNHDIRAVAITLPTVPAAGDLSGIGSALVGNFAGGGSASLRALSTQAHAQGRRVEFYFYPDAKGRFYDPDDTVHFRADAAALARRRTEDFILGRAAESDNRSPGQ